LTSEVTARARALVAERLPEASGLGQALTDLIDEPEQFAAVLRDGLQRLADDEYATGVRRIAPGPAKVFGVREPLLEAIVRQLRPALKESSPSSALWLAERLAVEEERELVLFSHVPMRRSLPDDPERTWQLIRRLAHRATDWICVDSLADLVAQGILLEPFRWAEIEQLVYSSDRWERRLVGSTIARLPFALPRRLRPRLAGTAGLTLIESLLGDPEPDVQKALSWALRSWNEVDPGAVRRLIAAEAERARGQQDGNRAWVLRDALTWPGLDASYVRDIRARLEGVRRRAGSPSTSRAGLVAREFVGVDRLDDRSVDQQGVRQRMAVGSR
jgi:3-methyladenine DNA glycosylase AlkD